MLQWPQTVLSLLASCVGSMLVPIPLQAAEYSFTKADDLGEVHRLCGAPAINNAGTVAFAAIVDGGGNGVFTREFCHRSLNGAGISRVSSLPEPP